MKKIYWVMIVLMILLTLFMVLFLITDGFTKDIFKFNSNKNNKDVPMTTYYVSGIDTQTGEKIVLDFYISEVEVEEKGNFTITTYTNLFPTHSLKTMKSNISVAVEIPSDKFIVFFYNKIGEYYTNKAGFYGTQFAVLEGYKIGNDLKLKYDDKLKYGDNKINFTLSTKHQIRRMTICLDWTNSILYAELEGDYKLLNKEYNPVSSQKCWDLEKELFNANMTLIIKYNSLSPQPWDYIKVIVVDKDRLVNGDNYKYFLNDIDLGMNNKLFYIQ